MQDLLAIPGSTVEHVLSGGEPPVVALVLGSGLSDSLPLDAHREIPYGDIPGFPQVNGLPGHAGSLLLGAVGGVRAAVFAGRIHVYQGLSAHAAAFPARLAAALGAGTLIVTNAAGSLVERLGAGSLALIGDHLNLLGDDPLRGWTGGSRGEPFVSMADAYDLELRRLAEETADELGFSIPSAVYAAVAGPCYETAAEAEMLRRLGAEIVGMSTVPEVIVARASGMRVLGLSLVTNAAGGSAADHAGVVTTAGKAAPVLGGLIAGILMRL